jgi:hypothetical protein
MPLREDPKFQTLIASLQLHLRRLLRRISPYRHGPADFRTANSVCYLGSCGSTRGHNTSAMLVSIGRGVDRGSNGERF